MSLANMPQYAASAESIGIEAAFLAQTVRVAERFDKLLLQLHIQTADELLHLWEKLYGIQSSASDDLSHRRERMRSKIRGVGTATKKMIQNMAESYAGVAVEVTERPADYTVEIKFVGQYGIPKAIDEFYSELCKTIPAHLACELVYVYMTWERLTSKRWEDLTEYTWEQVRNGESN